MASSQSTGRACVAGDDRPSEPPSQMACVESGVVAGASALSISATDKFGQGRSEGKDDAKLNFTLVYKRGSLRRSSRSVSSSHAVAKLELLPSTTSTLWQFRQMGGFSSKEVRKKRSFNHRCLRDSAWGALEHLTGISSPDPRVVKVQKKGSKKAKCRLGEKGRQKARKDGSSRGSSAKCMFLSSRPRVQVDMVNFAAGTPNSLSDCLPTPDSLVDLGVGVVVDGCEHNIVTQMADVTSISNENPVMSFDASFRNGSHGNKEMESTVTQDVSVENTSGECPMVPGLVGPIYDKNLDQGTSPDLDVLHLIPQSGSITSESVDTYTLRETFSDDGMKNQNDLNPESKVEADSLNIASGSFGASDELLPAKHAKQKKGKKKGKIRGTPHLPSEHKCVEKAVLNPPDSKKTRKVNRSRPSQKVQNSFHSRKDSHSEISGNIGEMTTRVGELLDEPEMHRETFQKNEREAHALNLGKGGGSSFSGVMGNNSALSSPEGTSTCSQASSEGMLSSVMVPGSEDDLAPKKSLAWASCDDCGKWRRIPNVLVDVIGQTDSKWTCKDNTDKNYADCSVPQEMSDEDINLELGIPNTSCEDNSCIVQLNSKGAFGFDEATEGRAFLPFVVRGDLYLEFTPSLTNKGYGLQLQEDVSKGDFLIEYVGEVLDLPEYEARQRHYASRGQKHFYFMTLNGSEWMVNGEVCVGLFATRDLKKGEEVTFDYNYVRVFGAVAKKCVCGSAGCRGYIGGDPLKTEAVDQDHSDDDYPEPVMITERLRDPRGLRRAGLAPNGARSFAHPNSAAALRRGGIVRSAEKPAQEDQPAPKRRLSSAVVEDGEVTEEMKVVDVQGGEPEVPAAPNRENDIRPVSHGGRESRRVNRMEAEGPVTNHVPRVLPKEEDASVVKRNRRMLGQLLGTLETLRARVIAKAEEKKMELLFLRWSEHHKKLCNFQRTKAEPPIFYLPNKPIIKDPAMAEQQREQAFIEWKSARRDELTQFQKQLEEQYVANAEAELQRWQNVRNARRVNNAVVDQETMDKELETHQMEHGPKTRRIPGSNEEEEDVEDIVGDDDMMDDVLEVDDGRKVDEATKPEDEDNGSPGAGASC
ncbi:Histone-lysine N-methyltransferase ASHH2 [Acorus calamus]|uniref:Histone-lysine N-methyltransferase ASHH2 n=1 Tax=Acorus calamus TaxID=4465 RepID=A0AAV9E773_ACOCL|nr:Histone-lysine N-methyltransferase ASHH2 [Acorus calamus]